MSLSTWNPCRKPLVLTSTLVPRQHPESAGAIAPGQAEGQELIVFPPGWLGQQGWGPQGQRGLTPTLSLTLAGPESFHQPSKESPRGQGRRGGRVQPSTLLSALPLCTGEELACPITHYCSLTHAQSTPRSISPWPAHRSPKIKK